jgi:hypothetical protein
MRGGAPGARGSLNVNTCVQTVTATTHAHLLVATVGRSTPVASPASQTRNTAPNSLTVSSSLPH